MKELTELLTKAGKAYYQESREIMSNFEYDRLYDELQKLEEETGIVLAGSPTRQVGYEVLEELPKERHEQPMLSLDKTKEVEVLKDFVGAHKVLLSWKMDGLTVVLTYREGTLFKAVTRGNGEIGEVITNNARVFENVPLTIPYKGELVLRGEAVISLKEAGGQIKLHCYDFAPTPERNESEVLSLFSDSYRNKITANWNPRWQYSTAEYEDMDTGDNHIGYYSNLNFVGIVFNSVADCSAMTHLHLDVLSMDEIGTGSEFKVEIHESNSNNNIVYLATKATHPDFKAGQWLSLDIPLNDAGKQITQLVLGCDSNTKNILLDNIYFY